MPPSRPQCRGRCGTRATALAPPRSAAHSNLFCQRTFCHTYHKLSFSVPDGHLLIPHSDHDQKKYIICLIVTWCWSLLAASRPPACRSAAPPGNTLRYFVWLLEIFVYFIVTFQFTCEAAGGQTVGCFVTLHHRMSDNFLREENSLSPSVPI